jgi:hypothetical protein
MVPWDELDFMEHDPWRQTLSYYRRLLWERKIRRDHGVNYLLTRLLWEQGKVTIAELREHLSTQEGVERLMSYYLPPSMDVTLPPAGPGEDAEEKLVKWLRERFEEDELWKMLRREKRRNREKRRKALLYKLLLDEGMLRVGEAREKFNNNKPSLDTVHRWLKNFVEYGLAERRGRGIYALAQKRRIGLPGMVEIELRAYLSGKAADGGVHRNTLGRWMKRLLELGVAWRIGPGYYAGSRWLRGYQGWLEEAIKEEIWRRKEESISAFRVTEEDKERIKRSLTRRWRLMLHDELAKKELGIT